jgi:hypothetical protein
VKPPEWWLRWRLAKTGRVALKRPPLYFVAEHAQEFRLSFLLFSKNASKLRGATF